jgi:hypothetical protein
MSVQQDHSRDKTALRFAKKVHAFAHEHEPPTHDLRYEANLLNSIARRADKLQRQLQAASNRNFPHLSATPDHFKHSLRSGLGNLANLSDTVDEEIRKLISSPKLQTASLSSIYADILKLYLDFPKVKISLQHKSITVTTDLIILFDSTDNAIDLGPFEITLVLGGYFSEPKLRWTVQSLHPHRPPMDPDLSHPHVRYDRLCAGDAYFPLYRCLTTGQIYEFFQVFRTTLQTYSEETAYMSLHSWFADGRCYNCDRLLSIDDSYSCIGEGCDHLLCDECGFTCECGEGLFCHSCTDYCYECESYFCNSCLIRCVWCERLHCPDCTRTCFNCQKPVCQRHVQVCESCNEEYCTGHSFIDGCCEECQDKEEETEGDKDKDDEWQNSPSPPLAPLSASDWSAIYNNAHLTSTAWTTFWETTNDKEE